MKYFPAIFIQKTNTNVRGFSALKLESILQGELLAADTTDRYNEMSTISKMNPVILQNTRKSFLQALSNLDESLSLEISIGSFPNLANPAASKVEILFFICGENKSEDMVKEKIITAFLNIKPILAALFPEADFRPVLSLNVLMEMRKYDIFKNALSIDRKFKNVALDSPFVHKQIGFGLNDRADVSQAEQTIVQHIFQWIPSYDDWSSLINIMVNQIDPVRLILRLKSVGLQNQTLENLRETVSACDNFLVSSPNVNITLKEQSSLIRSQALSRIRELMEGCFNIGVFILTLNSTNGFLGKMLGNAITGEKDKTGNNTFWQGGFCISNVSVQKAADLNYFSDHEPFSSKEAACAFRLPNPPFGEAPAGFPVKRFRTALARINKNNKNKDAILIGVNVHKGIEQSVKIDSENRFRHCFILGQTGTGKSTFMENMILQDIQAGRGVGVIDPHGEMIDRIIGKIPVNRTEDVVLFDPLDIQRPMGFNVLEWETIQERDLIIDEIYQTFNQMYDFRETGGPMFEFYFRGALALLMGDHKRDCFVSTILDIVPFFLDENFRKYLKNTVNDIHLHDFLDQTEAVRGDAEMKNISPYITSKFSRFQDTTLKRIIGQPHTTFNVDNIINTGKIFLMKLGKGRFGGVTSALLANMVVSRIKLAAMKRIDSPKSEKRDFFIYIDEAHNLPGENFMELLSEARKSGLGIVLATQYAAQLAKSSVGTRDNLLSALLGNVGQTIVFRLGLQDATQMADSFKPTFGQQDIISLPNWHGYVRMQQNSSVLPPFSIRSAIDKTSYSAGLADKIKELSRIKYGVDCYRVDKTIHEHRYEKKEKS